MSTNQRFELVVSLALTVLIVAALAHLLGGVALLLVHRPLDPADQLVFQAVTVLIAPEFNRSTIGVRRRKHSIAQVRTVSLIALLALVRKFLILDASYTEPLISSGSRRRASRSARSAGWFAARTPGAGILL